LHRLIHGPLSKDFDYLLSAQNLKKAEVEVDLLGDEVDNLVALLERVSTVLEHYSPVLQHYPGVAISQLSFCQFSLDCCYCSHFFIGFLGGQPGVFSFLL
jgi:hypothetical protein